MNKLFLLGGGRNEAAYIRTFWRFIDAATDEDDNRSLAIVIVVGPDADRAALEAQNREPFALFEPVRKEQCHVMFVSREEPLTAQRLAEVQATGIFVAGGQTGAYYHALCADRGWLDYVREHGLAYAGYSAGAVIAADRAVMGGWLMALLHSNTEVAAEPCSEGLDFTEVRDGLGLVPFAIDVHATQWGTLTRLIHLVGEGAVPCGWAIDENCMLEIDGDTLRVFGANNAYRVRRLGDSSVRTDVFRAGTVLRRADW